MPYPEINPELQKVKDFLELYSKIYVLNKASKHDLDMGSMRLPSGRKTVIKTIKINRENLEYKSAADIARDVSKLLKYFDQKRVVGLDNRGTVHLSEDTAKKIGSHHSFVVKNEKNENGEQKVIEADVESISQDVYQKFSNALVAFLQQSETQKEVKIKEKGHSTESHKLPLHTLRHTTSASKTSKKHAASRKSAKHVDVEQGSSSQRKAAERRFEKKQKQKELTRKRLRKEEIKEDIENRAIENESVKQDTQKKRHP